MARNLLKAGHEALYIGLRSFLFMSQTIRLLTRKGAV